MPKVENFGVKQKLEDSKDFDDENFEVLSKAIAGLIKSFSKLEAEHRDLEKKYQEIIDFLKAKDEPKLCTIGKNE